jgi:branched-chain amino acid transport system permease protein
MPPVELIRDPPALAFFLVDEKFRQTVIVGLVIGSLYALIALGFVLIYKASQVVNFAQGEFVMLGGYIAAVLLTAYNIPLMLALPLVLLIGAALGMVVERLMLRPLIGKPLIAIVMATIGLAAILRGGVATLWLPFYSPDNQRELPGLSIFGFKPFDDTIVNILDTPIRRSDLWAVGLAVLFIVAFTIFFRYTRTGIAMQAVADDQGAAQAQGISVKQVFAIAWAIAIMVAFVGGMLLGVRQGVSVTNLSAIGLKVFPAVILGGLESLTGAIVGGIVIGLLEQFTGAYLNPPLERSGINAGGLDGVMPFVVLIVILMIRPHGLFGRPAIERV